MFSIIFLFIAAIECKYYPPPINGALSSKPYFGTTKALVSCNKGYDFATTPAKEYLCHAGEWFVDPWDLTMPWPDCTGKFSLPIVFHLSGVPMLSSN